MMHKNRRWCVTEVASAEELAFMLTQRTWTLCAGFCVKGHERYLFLNDSTHEDGAGEWAVLKRDGPAYLQVESITFSWCRPADACRYIEDALAGRMDDSTGVLAITPRIDAPGHHRHCRLCE